METLIPNQLIFFASIFCFRCFSSRIERDVTGDIFLKNWPSKNFTIAQCDRDVEGSGHARNLNTTACQCTWEQTFFIDSKISPPVAKCFKSYGQDITKDLGCKYHFKGKYSILILTPSSTQTNIGQVVFHNMGSSKSLRNYSIDQIAVWNVEWHIPPGKLLQMYPNGDLKWLPRDVPSILHGYRGTLFKINVTAYEATSSQIRSSCLLFKIAGGNNYPIALPDIPLSAITTVMTSTLATMPLQTTTTATIFRTVIKSTSSLPYSSIYHDMTTQSINTQLVYQSLLSSLFQYPSSALFLERSLVITKGISTVITKASFLQSASFSESAKKKPTQSRISYQSSIDYQSTSISCNISIDRGTKTSRGVNTAVAAGTSVAVAVLLGIIILVLLMKRKNRKKMKVGQKYSDENETEMKEREDNR